MPKKKDNDTVIDETPASDEHSNSDRADFDQDSGADEQVSVELSPEDAVNDSGSLEEEVSGEELSPLDILNAKFVELESQLQLEKESSLRAYAELENFKRRKEQEKSDYLKFATEQLILDLLSLE